MPPKYAFKLGYAGNFLSTLWQPSEAKQRNAEMYEDETYYVLFTTKIIVAKSGGVS